MIYFLITKIIYILHRKHKYEKQVFLNELIFPLLPETIIIYKLMFTA